MTVKIVHVLDLESGNLRSLYNAVTKLGYEVKWIKTPEEGLDEAEVRAMFSDYPVKWMLILVSDFTFPWSWKFWTCCEQPSRPWICGAFKSIHCLWTPNNGNMCRPSSTIQRFY